jgi:4-carboxymuconolactone decarboxylase
VVRLKIVFATVLLMLTSTVTHAQDQGAKEGNSIRIWRSGSQPSRQADAEHFTGSVRVDPLFPVSEPGRTTGSLVTFDAGARTAWHTHPLGQILIVTAGEGRVQAWGEPVEIIRKGDVVWISAGQKHWHGAAPNASVAHIAIVEQVDGGSVTWMNKVTDGQYAATPEAVAAEAHQTAAQPAEPKPKPSAKAIGDFDPKLAQITDDVLYGDVWERPELSKRDRSLITAAALIAMNRPDQLRSHLIRARENGVTEKELVETITQMAFYAGWPNAVTAVGVARDVFQKK